MTDSENDGCSCAKHASADSSGTPSPPKSKSTYILAGILFLIAWGMIYINLKAISVWCTYSLLKLRPGEPLSAAVEFFIFDTPTLLMLLGLVSFLMGMIHPWFTSWRVRRILSGKRQFWGNIMAAFLGIFAPVWSCCAVPVFIAFLSAEIPLGVAFSFLIASPMINKIAPIMLYGLFGWRIALVYMLSGLAVSIIAGWIIGRMKLESAVEAWVHQSKSTEEEPEKRIEWEERVRLGIRSARDIVRKTWPYVLAGIAIGAAIHNYVPESFLQKFLGRDAWWSVPVAVLLGIPMYSNAAGIMPVIQALLAKGFARGTVVAFMMGGVGLSLPQMVILRRVLKPKLIGVFLGVVYLGIVSVGCILNFLNF